MRSRAASIMRSRAPIAAAALLLLVSASSGTVRAEWRYDTVPWTEGAPVNRECMQLDAEDRPHFAHPSADGLRHTWWDGLEYRSEIVVPGAEEGLVCALALDPDMRPLIAYRAANGALKVASWDGLDWLIETVDVRQEAVKKLSLSLGPTGVPHVAYLHPVPGHRPKLLLASRSGEGWSITSLAEDVLDVVSLAVGRDGQMHVAFRRIFDYPDTHTLPDGPNLIYGRWDGQNWWEEVPKLYPEMDGATHITSIDIGKGARIRLDPEDGFQIVFSEWTEGCIFHWRPWGWGWDEPVYCYLLWRAWREPEGWHIARVSGPPSDPLGFRLDPLGRLHVAYYGVGYEGPIDEDLLAEGRDPELALTSGGAPFIAYEPWDSSCIRLAYWHDPDLYLDLLLQDPRVRPGDLLWLQRRARNRTPDTLALEEYVALEMGGALYFWPLWDEVPESQDLTLAAGEYREDQILDLTWPAGCGSLYGLRFWGVAVDRGTTDLRAFDMVEWSFFEP